MKRFYLKVRIGLMTFALGLASVFVINGSLQFSDEVVVNLPETESSTPIVIYLTDKECSNYKIKGSNEFCVRNKE